MRKELAANRRVTDKVNQQFAIVEGSNNIVRCTTCRTSIQNKLSAKKMHVEGRSHLLLQNAQANPADNIIPPQLAINETITSDHAPMEVDLEALGVYNPSTQTSVPANGFNLYHYLREQAERARLEAEAEELDGRKKDEETFKWESSHPQ
ncbi:hypothetical protein DFS34DRAFT_647325 [Phlyctochytrium arcticum]|nr:hypothetical protein DFS34DRAFT_647325 [Phlyctochytrium arcticum]